MENNERLFLGLDIGGTKSAAIVGDGEGQIRRRIQWASDAARGPAAMIDEICAHGAQLIRDHLQIADIGVAIGGPLNAAEGIILSPPNLPGWDRIPLKQILHDRLGLPVTVEHDAAACALAEYRWGAGRGKLRLVYLTCGTGFGAGIVLDGKIYHGAAGRSLEIGHARFREDGPDAFGKVGSVEAYCAGASLGKLAAWKFPLRWKHSPSADELSSLWRAGDSDATEIIEINARAIGEVCANLGDLLRPDIIILGSLAAHLGPPWIEMVRARFLVEALPDTAECSIEPAALGARLQDLSALIVAIPSGPAPARDP